MIKNNDIFTGAHFDSKKQVAKILAKKDISKHSVAELCEMAFDKAVQECRLKRSRYERQQEIDQDKFIKKKRKECFELRKDNSNKPATLKSLKIDTFYELKKKIEYDDVVLVVDAFCAVVRRFVLQGIRVRFDAFFDIGLASVKATFNANSNKWRIGVMKLKLSTSPVFRKEVSSIYPFEEYTKEEMENPYKSNF